MDSHRYWAWASKKLVSTWLVYYTWVSSFSPLPVCSLTLVTILLCCHRVTGSVVGMKCETARVVIHSRSCTCDMHTLSWSYSLVYTNIERIHAHATCVRTTSVCCVQVIRHHSLCNTIDIHIYIVYAHIYVCVCARACAHIYIHKCIHMYIHTYIQTYINACIHHMHIHIRTYTHMYMCNLYIHIPTQEYLYV